MQSEEEYTQPLLCFKMLHWKEQYCISGPNFTANVAKFHCVLVQSEMINYIK